MQVLRVSRNIVLMPFGNKEVPSRSTADQWASCETGFSTSQRGCVDGGALLMTAEEGVLRVHGPIVAQDQERVHN